MNRFAAVFVLTALLFSSAHAANTSNFGVGLQVGTTGYGLDAAYKINDALSARIGYSGLNYSHSANTSDVDYDAKLKLSGFRALADIGIGAGFRVSTGLMFHDNKIDVHGKPTSGSYTLNGNRYQASDIGSLDGRVKFGSGVAPYIGLGYGTLSNRSGGPGFYADIGAMYQGKSKASLSANCGAALNNAQCNQLSSDISAEESKVNDKINQYKWYPVISFGIYYNF